MKRKRLTRAGLAALNKVAVGVYYPRGNNSRATLTTPRKPVPIREGRRSW